MFKIPSFISCLLSKLQMNSQNKCFNSTADLAQPGLCVVWEEGSLSSSELHPSASLLNWKATFSELFRKKESSFSTLKFIYFIRNKKMARHSDVCL